MYVQNTYTCMILRVYIINAGAGAGAGASIFQMPRYWSSVEYFWDLVTSWYILIVSFVRILIVFLIASIFQMPHY